MNRRFYIGCLFVIAINLGIVSIFATKHHLMEAQDSFLYVFEFAPWWMWASWFSISGGLLCGSLFRCSDMPARVAVVLSAVGLATFTATLLLVPIDPHTPSITGFVPFFSGALCAFEIWFLALPSNDWLDVIPNGKLPQKGRG